MGGMPTLDIYLARQTLAGFRPQTIRVRKVCLTAFAATVPDLVHATREDLERFLARPLAPASRRAYAAHLKSFYRYLIEEGLRQDDPTEKLPRFRVPPGVPRPISDKDLSLALDRADRRMRAWLLLMSLSGLRCMEVAGLEPRDLVATDDGILMHLRETKGGGSATVPAHPDVVKALAVLPVRDEAWWDLGALAVSNLTNEYLRSLGIKVTAHALRHGFITAAYEASGRDILTTAALSRHSNLNNVRIYAKINPRRPAEVVNLLQVPYGAAS